MAGATGTGAQSAAKAAAPAQAIAQQATTALEANTGSDDKSANQKKLDDAMTAIEGEITAMIPHVSALLGTGPLGTEKNPIPIDHPKRRSASYVLIYIGPKSGGRIEQGWLGGRDMTKIMSALSTEEAGT